MSLLAALTAAATAGELAAEGADQAPPTLMVAQVPPGGTVSSIRVEGTQRVEPATVQSYLTIRPGDRFDPDQVNESLKALFATGLFADVVIGREGEAVVVRVVENPIINRIAFEGNQRIDNEQLQSEIQLRPRVVFTRTLVQSDVQRILELYRRNGRFAATVEPKVIERDQNRVDLVFEVDEGPRTGVKRINFIGNKAYGDGTLREKIQTKETAWYRFLSSDDSYDPDRVNYDAELLRRFYLSEGYADFRVVSSVADLAPERDGFFITFTIEEGERYKFGEIKLATTLKGLDAETLRPVLTTDSGAWYDNTGVERSRALLGDAVSDLRYQFVDVTPQVQRNREQLTIDVTYQIAEGPRVFVERIDITGNVRTVDDVVRREMQIIEGDPFNATKLRRSEQQIRDLGFFERVNVATTEGSEQDRTVIDVDVTEQSTGEIALGAGFSTTDGPLADFQIRERNFLGRGQDFRIGATLSGRRQEYDFSFTEPYFLERDLQAGVDVFRITRDNQSESSFDEQNTGFGLRMGYPLSPHLRQRLFYSFTNRQITDVQANASRYVRDQEGTRNISLIGQELYYDRRNSKLDPTEGYYLRFITEAAGVAGDTQFLRARVGGGYYYPVSEGWTLSAIAEMGQIYGLGDDVNIADRFFLGGDNLRGFEVAGVGPRDTTTDDALGANQFARASVELSFPLGLPEEFSLNGHVFTDAGTAGSLDVSGVGVVDTHALRVSSGAGVSWKSPLGPIRLDLAFPLLKESYDKEELIRFSFGTRF